MKKCFGVGLCDVDYKVQIEGPRKEGKRDVLWRCPYYQTWMSIMRRAYSEKQQKRSPTYRGCSVDERWHKLTSFKSWVEAQPLHSAWLEDNQAIQVDKDFIVDGNKIYGPDTCVLLPSSINVLLCSLKHDIGDYPLGVFYKKANKKFQSQIFTKGKKLYLGLYEDPIKGHFHWQLAKVACLQDTRDEYEELVGHDPRVLEKLNFVIETIRSDILQGRETRF